jgi:electron transfer flavoprotein alpha subunit
MERDKGILILGELDGEQLSLMTTQLMRIGKKISEDLGQELSLIFFGSESSKEAETGYGYGADKVYTAIDPSLDHYMTDVYLQAMEQVVQELKPSVILFGQNDMGLDLAPSLAFRLKTGVSLDCVDLISDPGKGILEQVKPVFGGKAQAVFTCDAGRPQIASVREGAFDPQEYDESLNKEAVPLNLSLDPSRIRTRFLKKEKDESLDLALKLAAANIVVSGGRGLKNKSGMDLLRETADLLGGAVAGSRPAVDYGWLPSSLQVGLTGKKVNPQVYMAVGISGALQHMAGCSKSKNILAINSDESAPIFKLSHMGIVGDFREVLKGFNDEIKKIKEKK